MWISPDLVNIMRRTAEKILNNTKISVYKSANSLVMSYAAPKMSKMDSARNQLSISVPEIEAYKGEPQEFLKKRVELFIELFKFLKNIMPEIVFISEDTDTIGVSFKKVENKKEEIVRLYYEKQIFSHFEEDPATIKMNFIKETKKRQKLLKDAS